MEEDIKILEEIIESAEKSINRLEDNDLSGTMRGVLELRKRQTQSLLNLINKNKELEKIVELMAKELSRKKGMIKKVCGKCNYEECIKLNIEECIIEHYKKKASEENEN